MRAHTTDLANDILLVVHLLLQRLGGGLLDSPLRTHNKGVCFGGLLPLAPLTVLRPGRGGSILVQFNQLCCFSRRGRSPCAFVRLQSIQSTYSTA